MWVFKKIQPRIYFPIINFFVSSAGLAFQINQAKQFQLSHKNLSNEICEIKRKI